MKSVSDLPPLRDVIARYQLAAKKSLGQNFLLDLNLTAKIANAAGSNEGMTVVEVGPGPGGLTRALLGTKAREIVAIERDHRFSQALSELADVAQGRLRVIENDALQTDIPAIAPAPRAIIANLPYNIATPLLTGWLGQIDDYQYITIMLQKEVALRVTAKTGCADYGRLSVLCQWLTQAEILFDVPPSAFVPPPKVTSSIVYLTPRKDRRRDVSIADLEKITRAAFGQRRKMLRKGLQQLLPDPIPLLEKCGIDPTLRAENVSVDGFLDLAYALNSEIKDGSPGKR